jgi:hypothetical protein
MGMSGIMTLSARVPPVSIVTVSSDGYLFIRLLVERVRATVGNREYEIVVVHRGGRDGSLQWLRQQPDVRVLMRRQWWWQKEHHHGEAAEAGVRRARHRHIVLLDSDAHPMESGWLENSIDLLSDRIRLVGARFVDRHTGNPHGFYIHPHFMCFYRDDLGDLVVLRKLRGDTTDTGEEATIRVLERGYDIIGHPIVFAEPFAVGHPRVPTAAGGVFHAWYMSRLMRNEAEVIRETQGVVSRANYHDPLVARLRERYALNY